MNNTIGNKREVIDFFGKRIRHYTTLSFDQVLAELRARVGETTASFGITMARRSISWPTVPPSMNFTVI